jgi:hypothetical protein
MPKRLSKKSRRREIADPNLSAFRVIEHLTRDEPKPSKVVRLSPTKNAAAVALGRKGGIKSAAGRMEKISPEDRRRIASNAARERWRKEKGDG